ncbi:hypothetical protein UC34_21010 [Pandoraea vervacti]|uniref:Transcription factor zinc-finger domain-containing protein n=1 Tax=Pandoraea vervacti TaxID=656178 RepID=A0ABM5T1T3_9BURK|nr:zf-TFIIB domain-containing protein [Pandoraea vervacti]AJP58741.1 hypothetical protein UC34_21010 [Pandoraea vervacti]
MKCPVCGTPDLLMTERQGVEIDYCPNCRGVWLDRGELDKLIERTDGMQGASRQVAQGGFGRSGYDSRDTHGMHGTHGMHDKRRYAHDDDRRDGREYREPGDQRSAHHGHDDRRRQHDRPRKKKSLFEMFDFD